MALELAYKRRPAGLVLGGLAAGLGVRPEELGTPSFPVRSPAQVASSGASTPLPAEAAAGVVEAVHSLVAEVSDYLDRLLRRSYAAVKLESADPALRPLFEDLAARLMKDDAKTRAMRVKVLRKVMEADFSLLGIVDAWLGDGTRGGGGERAQHGPTAREGGAQTGRRRDSRGRPASDG